MRRFHRRREGLLLAVIPITCAVLVASCYRSHLRPEQECPSDNTALNLPFFGSVSLSGDGSSRFTFAGRFLHLPAEAARRSDPLVQIVAEDGPCVAIQARAGPLDDDPGEVHVGVNDGASLAVITRQPRAPGDGMLVTTGMASPFPFAPGDLIRFSSTGGAVPAFETCVVAPPRPEPTVPAVITRNAPFTITWAATSATGVSVDVSTPTSAIAIECSVPASALQLTIPASITASLVAEMGDVYVSNGNGRTFAAGAYEVHAAAGLFVAARVLVE